MARIKLSFRDDLAAEVLNGRKTATIRDKRKAWPGEYFELGGRRFIIKAVAFVSLGDAVNHFYHEDGCLSPQHTFNTFKDLYPYRAWSLDDLVYVHVFEAVPVPSHLDGSRKP